MKRRSSLLALCVFLAVGCGDDHEGTTVPSERLPASLQAVSKSLDAADLEYYAEVLDTLGEDDRAGLIVSPDSESPVVIRNGGLADQVRVEGVTTKVLLACKGYVAEAETGKAIKAVLDEASLCPALRN